MIIQYMNYFISHADSDYVIDMAMVEFQVECYVDSSKHKFERKTKYIGMIRDKRYFIANLANENKQI